MIEITEKIRLNWANKEALQLLQLEIVEELCGLCTSIQAVENMYDQNFLAEKEDAYKITDSMAKTKARLQTSNIDSLYKNQFVVLQIMINLISERISLLHQEA